MKRRPLRSSKRMIRLEVAARRDSVRALSRARPGRERRPIIATMAAASTFRIKTTIVGVCTSALGSTDANLS